MGGKDYCNTTSVGAIHRPELLLTQSLLKREDSMPSQLAPAVETIRFIQTSVSYRSLIDDAEIKRCALEEARRDYDQACHKIHMYERFDVENRVPGEVYSMEEKDFQEVIDMRA
jgi:hypothetical protein